MSAQILTNARLQAIDGQAAYADPLSISAAEARALVAEVSRLRTEVEWIRARAAESEWSHLKSDIEDRLGTPERPKEGR